MISEMWGNNERKKAIEDKLPKENSNEVFFSMTMGCQIFIAQAKHEIEKEI